MNNFTKSFCYYKMGANSSKVLKGVSSIGEYKFGNKTIYIFGDEHENFKIKCPDQTDKILFVDLLKNTFEYMKNNNRTVDFFIEIDMNSPNFLTRKDRNNSKSFLWKLNDSWIQLKHKGKLSSLAEVDYEFENCIYKKDCEYTNVRFHYTNIRHIGTFKELNKINSELEDIIGIINESGETEDLLYKYKVTKQEWIENIGKYFPINDTIIKSILKEYKINKQLDKISPLISKKLMDLFLHDEITSLCKSLLENNFELEKINKLDILDTYDIIFNIKNYMRIIFDMYLLSRAMNPMYNNIIINVGDTHASIYRKILKILTFTELNYSSDNESHQCVNIDKFNLPLFS